MTATLQRLQLAVGCFCLIDPETEQVMEPCAAHRGYADRADLVADPDHCAFCDREIEGVPVARAATLAGTRTLEVRKYCSQFCAGRDINHATGEFIYRHGHDGPMAF